MKRGPFGTQLGGSFGSKRPEPDEWNWGASTGVKCRTCGKPIRFGREQHRQGNTFYDGRWKIDCPGRFCTKEAYISDAQVRALQTTIASNDLRKVCLVLRKIVGWTYPYEDLDSLEA